MKTPKFDPPAPSTPAPAPAPTEDGPTADEIANAKKRAAQTNARAGRKQLRVDLTRPSGGSGVSIPQ